MMARTRAEIIADLPDQRPHPAPEDRMADAGRRVMAYHFRRMLLNEPDTRSGADIEALHDMRVAIRRMRAALRVFGAFFARRAARDLTTHLRQTGRALGPVRDVDVLLEHIETYRASTPEVDVSALVSALDAERERRRQDMLAYLDSDAYPACVEILDAFCNAAQPPRARTATKIRPATVGEVAPIAIYRRLGRVRSYETIIAGAAPEVLHEIRIQTKRLRYTLEFFRDALGKEARDVIEAAVALQDHLGLFQDAYAAQAIITALPADDLSAGATTYLDFRMTGAEKLARTAQKPWKQLTGPVMRRKLARAVGAL